MSACASARRRRRRKSGCRRARRSLSSASCPFATGKARTERRAIPPRSSRTTSSSCRTAVSMEPAAAPAMVRRPRPTAAATAKPRSAPTSTMSLALSDIGPRFSCPLTLARMAKRRGEAASSRFSPAVLSLACGGGGGNDATHSSKLITNKRQRKGRGTSMFKELLPLLEGRTMILTAARIGDALTVTIYPKRNGERDENPVGNTPLCVTGTAEELDHELPGLIAGYVEELGKFHSNLGQIKQQLADAATAAAEAAKVKPCRKPATAPAKAASKSAEPAEPPVARPDLFTASMPPAAAVPESQPDRKSTRL